VTRTLIPEKPCALIYSFTASLQEWHRHVAEVKAAIPAERLLIFDVREGWGPLCKFLDVPVPDKPFPNLNDAATLGKFFKVLSVFFIGFPILLLLLLYFVLTHLV
jgi:hypothetical protein